MLSPRERELTKLAGILADKQADDETKRNAVIELVKTGKQIKKDKVEGHFAVGAQRIAPYLEGNEHPDRVWQALNEAAMWGQEKKQLEEIVRKLKTS